jgi:polyvinyl alcohol dehydrogenase (cytochrome)
MNTARSLILLSTLSLAVAADLDGPAIYKQRCALCHDKSSETRAPAPAAMRLMSPENILRALETGLMKDQGASMPTAERKIIAEHLSGRAIGAAAEAKAGSCADPKAAFSLTGPSWNGWGADLANTRFQSATEARLTADQVPRLKLKWVFGYPNTFSSNGAPTLAGGRIFVPSANRNIYSLDAKTGCVYWSIETQAPVRTAITVASVATGERTRQVAFFGDQRGFAYGVDAASGELLWKVRIDEHARSKIVGAPVYQDARVYVPITAGEEGSAMSPAYECCSGRGGLVALEAATGKQIWKTYTIEETPRPTKKSATGGQLWGPSGASIWSAVTIDAERKIIYAGTGDNFSEPATKTSDAVVAFDMGTGKILWVKQLTENDTYNMACGQGAAKANCPDNVGPDVDIGASPILVKMANGKRVLLVSQKNGVAHGLDADNKGAILWQTRVGRGGTLGGIQWGSASDGKNLYVALSDITFKEKSYGAGGRRVLDPKGGGGLFALDVATGKQVWSASPPDCGDRPNCSPSQSAAIAMIPGVVFSGSVDAHIRGYSTRDGKVVWDFDTAQEFQTVNGLKAKGGSMDGPGPIIAGGMLYVPSGYGSWGGLPGNVLLAFSIDGK